jgi:phosphatidyl-myo-inositol alpha-mannosyltransferase
VRIGLVTEYYYPSIGGVQEHVHHLAREARRLGHTVRILTSDMPDLPPPTGEAAGPDVRRLGTSRSIYENGSFGRVSTGFGLSRRVRRALEREAFDVVHVHCPLTPVLPLLAAHHATCPVVGTFHSHFEPGLLFRLGQKVLQRYLDRLDAAVAVSRACLRPLEGRLEADFHIVPNGIDVERFSRGRRLARFADGRFNVLWVGRPEPRNGLDRMLRVFAALRRTIDARLLVMGDGPLRARYEAMVPGELSGDVVFAGRVLDERPDWYASADVYCAPTSIASFGVTLLEAMALGKPVLASDIEGYREVLHPGREGELLPVDDTAAWVEALLRLAREPLRARAHGEHGRATALRHAWPLIARDVLALYRRAGAAAG